MRNAIALLVLLTSTLLLGCDKDKFTTIPQAKIRDISPGEVYKGDLIRVRGSFTDQEGDLDSVIVVYKWYADALVTRKDTIRNSVEGLGLPAKLKEGDLFLNFAYGEQIDPYTQLGGTPVAKDTSAAFGIILIDKAGNRSDYIETDRVRFKKQ